MEDAEKSLGSPTGISVGLLAYAFIILLLLLIYALFKPIVISIMSFI